MRERERAIAERDRERDTQERDREIRNWIQERTEGRAKGRQEGWNQGDREEKKNSETGILSKAWRLRMKDCPIRPQVTALYTQFLHFSEKA